MRDRVCAGEKGDMAAEYCGGVVLQPETREWEGGGELKKLRIIFSILILSTVLSASSQNVLEKDDYFWNKAEKSRDEFYNSLEDNEECQLWEDAVAKVQQYLVPGESLEIDQRER